MNRYKLSLFAAAATVFVLTAGCNQHEDLPTRVQFETPPTPSNLAVAVDPTDDRNVDLTWSISDPSNVKEYRVYLLGGVAPDLVETTTATSTALRLPFGSAGIAFGVSSVSNENIEGTMTTAVTPGP